MATRRSAETVEADLTSELIGTPYPNEQILTDARYLRDFVFQVWFADGFTREIDMDGDLEGQVFEPLKERSYFAKLRYDPDGQTVVWPNGTDLSPEFLRWGHHTGPDCPFGLERANEPTPAP